MAKKRALGGFIYVVEPLSDGRHRVWKMPGKEGGPETMYEIDIDGVCSCPAGEFGNECKHVQLVEGRFEGEEITRRVANLRLEEYFERFVLPRWPDAKIVSLTRYGKSKKVRRGTALATGVLNGEGDYDQTTIWTEFGDMVMRIHVVRDRAEFKRMLGAARQRWTKEKEK